MTNDLARVLSNESRVDLEAVSNAEATLRDHSPPLRRPAGKGRAALGLLSAGSRSAKEMFKWAVQQTAAGEQGLPDDADGNASDEVPKSFPISSFLGPSTHPFHSPTFCFYQWLAFAYHGYGK